MIDNRPVVTVMIIVVNSMDVTSSKTNIIPITATINDPVNMMLERTRGIAHLHRDSNNIVTILRPAFGKHRAHRRLEQHRALIIHTGVVMVVEVEQ